MSHVMCNGHKYVKTSLFSSPGYLADLSPYINAVVSSRLLATPIQITTNAMKPIAQSILPKRASNYLLNETLTCEYCLHQVNRDNFDDGKVCPFQLLQRLGLDNDDTVLADHLLAAQDRRRIARYKDWVETSNESQSVTTNPTPRSATPNRSTVNDTSSDSQPGPSSSHETSSNKTRESSVIRNPLDDPHAFKEDILIMRICPELGLHQQKFTCVDCGAKISLSNSRLCNYDGRYYCYQCHTDSDMAVIPARILRNWDFTLKSVSRISMEKICFLKTRPVLFNLFQMNPMLYGFIDRLVEIKQIRSRIHSMLKYIEICGQPNRPNLMQVPKHILEEHCLNLFTLNDLIDINKQYESLLLLQTNLEHHIIRECESCKGKGFYCELCKDPRDILYPFSRNGSSCSKCKTVYHKNCFHRKKLNCPKCARLKIVT